MGRKPNLLQFAREQVSARLGKLVYQVRAASRKPHADAVHDLRVAIRRFAQGLEVFSPILPAGDTAKIRKRLRRLMTLAGNVRDRDITLELLREAGLKSGDPLPKHIAGDRKTSEKDFLRKVRRLNSKRYSAKWRSWLELSER